MKFPYVEQVKLLQLGAGGTGGFAAPNIYRMLYALKQAKPELRLRYILADGDEAEERNLIRQNFARWELGENKAESLAARFSGELGMEIEYIPEFIEDRRHLAQLLEPQYIRSIGNGPERRREVYERVILIGATDNNRSRKLCTEVFREMEDLIYIDAGNGTRCGQVVCGVRKEGRTLWKPVGSLYPEVMQARDKFPSELSCADEALLDTQSIAANLFAATAITAFVYNILIGGELRVRYLDFSTEELSMTGITRRRPARKPNRLPPQAV